MFCCLTIGSPVALSQTFVSSPLVEVKRNNVGTPSSDRKQRAEHALAVHRQKKVGNVAGPKTSSPKPNAEIIESCTDILLDEGVKREAIQDSEIREENADILIEEVKQNPVSFSVLNAGDKSSTDDLVLATDL